MHEIINNQRKIAVDIKVFENFLERLFETIEETQKKPAAIAFVSDRKMRELNREFRGKDKTTDVLSFPFEADEFDSQTDFLGDIVISLEQAQRQAAENDLDLETEVKQLILHGILHLCGYDHETDGGEMNRRERQLRKILEIDQ
jgi:probable rRNA maturation factor